MFVFHPEENPVEASDDLSHSHGKTGDCRLLDVAGEKGIADPLVAENHVDDHGCVVDGFAFVGQLVAEKEIDGMELEKRPVHKEVPDSTYEAIHGAEDDQQCPVLGVCVHPVQTEAHVVHAGDEVLAHVCQMRKPVPGVGETAEALEEPPDVRESGQETKQVRSR